MCEIEVCCWSSFLIEFSEFFHNILNWYGVLRVTVSCACQMYVDPLWAQRYKEVIPWVNVSYS
jgi:hypothetical protein